MIVLDASVAIEIVLGSPVGRGALDRIGDETLHAPQLLPVEVGQVLRRLTKAGEMTANRAAQALDDLLDLDIELYDHAVLMRRAWALRGNLTMYDATYIALAEVLEAPLLTTDGRLERSPGNRAVVELPSA